MSKEKDKAKLIRIVYPYNEEMPDDIYSNNVRVAYGPDDFILYFAKVDPPPVLDGEEYKDDKIKAKIVARIRLTPTVTKGLIRALSENIKKYEEKVKIGK